MVSIIRPMGGPMGGIDSLHTVVFGVRTVAIGEGEDSMATLAFIPQGHRLFLHLRHLHKTFTHGFEADSNSNVGRAELDERERRADRKPFFSP